jgi:hypothetical protein
MFPQILLRLEKYHYRINYAKGILETRNVTYNRSMRKLAKPLPLDTPTTIELAPGNSIRVTLIDANHCVGAVMFLIEGDGRAILYTGDIRAETWWVNSLVRNPVLIPYTFGKRRLNCIYLDTTFATKSEPYREFPGKAEGIQELLHKVSQYSEDTIFYFHAWTFGYEDVWVALSTSLGSRIHLDDYRAGIYGSLSTLQKRQLTEIGLNVQADNKSLRESGLEIREAPALCGFRNGNHIHPGCLTSQESVRIHSCERGMGCQVMDHDKKAKSVHIIPIITRANGVDIAELGAGGGKGDLDQKEALEMSGVVEIGKLMELCAATIKDAKLLSEVLALLHQTLARNDGKLDLDTHLHKTSGNSQGGLSLHTLASVLSANASKSATIDEPLNRTIRFPYSRHSSYSELCELVAAFRPDDIFPCTVDEEHWTPALSMQNLFGDLCTEHTFRHDAEMTRLYITKTQEHHRVKRNWKETQNDTQTSNEKLPVIQPNVKWIADSNEDDSYSAPADCATPVESIKRFCVLIFYTDAVEKCYEQHLETLARHDGLGEKLDIRIQLIGRILKAEEKLGKHAKIPVTEVSKKKTKKWKLLESLKDLTPETPSSASSDSSPVAPQHPGFKHVVLMSFPSSKEHGQYLKSEERKGLEDTVGIDEVNDGMILAKHMLLPPKSQPISANDWTYGNPHEPYGHDWFG